jgi:hypothetical protein
LRGPEKRKDPKDSKDINDFKDEENLAFAVLWVLAVL